MSDEEVIPVVEEEPKDVPVDEAMKSTAADEAGAAIVTFNDVFTKFVRESEKPVHIAFMTPAYESKLTVNYTVSLINTLNYLSGIGVKCSFFPCKNDSLVHRARNNLLALAMYDETITHFMFIDADITWQPIDVAKLLMANKPIIGGAYPKKRYNWALLTHGAQPILPMPEDKDVVATWLERKSRVPALNNLPNERFIQQNMLSYNINFVGSELRIDSNLVEVKHLATGFMLIKRDTIEKMHRGYPTTKYTDDVGFLVGEQNKYAYALFDTQVVDSHFLSEDWFFCHRWQKMNGKIYIDITINLIHTGVEDYDGSFINTFVGHQQQEQTKSPAEQKTTA